MSIKINLTHLSTRKTKIIATLGPASRSKEVIRDLIKAGVNVFRLNMSHGEHHEHRQIYQYVRETAAELKNPIAIFADLCGPKIRAGNFKDGSIMLTEGDSVVVTTLDVLGDDKLIPCQYQALADDVVIGDRVLLDDGKMELRVKAITGPDVTCEVIYGGELKNHKGMNLPGVKVSCQALTEKDRADALFALDLGVDYLALSFVRTAQDIHDLRDLITDNGFDTQIIAKIEKPEALENGQEIIQAANAIMIARGDLGVELPAEDVPIAQNQLIRTARAFDKPVIVATQMMESMIENSRPTRAEVTDVSNAVYLSTDAVMLSAETASGHYPVETVAMMSKIIVETEAFMKDEQDHGPLPRRINEPRPLSFGDAIADAVVQLCYDVNAKAIACIATTGRSTVTLSSARPDAPVIAITSDKLVCQRMNLYWGVVPVYSEETGHTNPNKLAHQCCLQTGLVHEDDNILLVRGFHQGKELNSPTITVMTL